MRKIFGFLAFVSVLLCFGLAQGADIVPDVIMMPGTQPEEASLEDPGRCINCHADYAAPDFSPRTEPGFGWMGSAMGNAGRDPIFWATLAIAEQDFDGAGDLCIRCHSAGGWVGGRSVPTDASGLSQNDEHGIDCDTCHQMANPDNTEHQGIMFDPFIANQEDLPYGPLPEGATEGYYGSGMYVLANDYGKLGPYAETAARHDFTQSEFHRDVDFCGTCHDVSNSAVGQLAPNGGAQDTAPAVQKTYFGAGFPLEPGVPANDPTVLDGMAAFNNPPYAYGIVERTYSEYKSSPLATWAVDNFGALPQDLQDPRGSLYAAYVKATNNNRGTADYADGTSSPRTFTCQTCHVSAITGQGCNKSNAPVRDDLPQHDMTGGNYWVYPLVQFQDQKGTLRLGDGLNADQIAAMDDGMLRAGTHLTQAATMDVNGNTVRITNMTGHKVISGYPEGRRMWLNIKWYDGNGAPLREDGAYGPILPAGSFMEYTDVNGQTFQFNPESILDLHDPNTKIYEVHPAMTQEWAAVLMSVAPDHYGPIPTGYDRLTGAPTGTIGGLAGQAPGTYEKTFHFVLNNHVADDNRIPPYLMDCEEARIRNALPIPTDQYGGPALQPGDTCAGAVYNHWDDIALNPPQGAQSADITLYYQGTSWEYVQFLYEAVNPDVVTPFLADEGLNYLDAWVQTGMVLPYVMATATWGQQQQCTYADPTVAISPAAQTITTDGGSVDYIVSVTNNDSGAACTATAFDLTVTDSNSTDFNASVLSQDPLVVNPGATVGTTLTVTAQPGVTTGVNDTSVSTIADANHGAVTSNTVTTTIDVQQNCNYSDPDVSITPESHTITTDGGSVNYIVSVTNNDTAGCGPTSFGLTVSDSNLIDFDPSTLSQDPLTVNPGATVGTTLTVTAQAGKTTGTNVTSVSTISDANHGAVTSNDVTTTINVADGCSAYPDRGSCKNDPACVWNKDLGMCVDAPNCSDYDGERSLCRDAGCSYDNQTGLCTP